MLRGERVERQVLRAERVDTGWAFDAMYHGAPIRDAAGGFVLGFLTIRDIGDVRRAERALAAGDARYRALVGSVDAGFRVIEMCYDADGRPVDYRFVEANVTFERWGSSTTS